MEYVTWYFFSITIISLFCLGWRTVTDDDMLLNFIRRMFDIKILQIEKLDYQAWNNLDAEDKKLYTPVKISMGGNVVKYEYEKPYYSVSPWWAKPFVLCVVCMPSFWGTIIYTFSCLFILPQMISVIHWSIIVFLFVPVIISCSYVTGLLWRLKSSFNVHT